MTCAEWAASVSAIGAGAIALLAAVGMWAGRNPFERLHFVTPVATISAILIAVAFWAGAPQKEVAAKVSFAALVLIVINAVVSQATARAIRTRNETAE